MWGCFGKAVFRGSILQLLKKCSKTEPNLEPKLPWGGGVSTHFHPWVDKVAQVVPNGAQSGSKGEEGYQNGAKMLPKVIKLLRQS